MVRGPIKLRTAREDKMSAVGVKKYFLRRGKVGHSGIFLSSSSRRRDERGGGGGQGCIRRGGGYPTSPGPPAYAQPLSP